ncbi:S26 family signal peptidase [Halopiger aswanensis]|uniref:S26 family signal peptidase n=1 Tax=Halopiger aswanensis TaxID=148449 RepID=UPI001FE85AC4|nr:S26 family signal peptidase [Halopiger aswanensis]
MSTKSTAPHAAQDDVDWDRLFRVSVVVFLLFLCSMVGVGFADRMPSHEIPFGYAMTAGTGSMEPTMTGGELVIYTDWGEVEEGDIIVFEDAQRDIDLVHRAVEDTEQGWVTKGDANGYLDQDRGIPHATEETIYGRELVHIDLPF